ncbi:MAG: LysR family transcriptional regulator [Clostridiales bacterium]|jgi:DNA-binding transcriptional LysR family regulator|nr:LysR family transcriptional regulator [Clostridiales bacterium]
MDIRTLEAFLSLANCLNFTKSAEQMYISQPAFSRQITRLEEELGCPLFNRSKRKVELTEFGITFIDYAERMYSEYTKLKIELNQMRNDKTMHLRIGFLCDLPHWFLPMAIQRFSERYSQVQLSMFDKSLADLTDSLLLGDLDLGFCVHTGVKPEEIEVLEISSAPICAVLPENHRYANETSICIEKLQGEPFIMGSPDIYNPGYRQIISLCKLGGFAPNIVAYCSMVPSMLTLVKCGIGIALAARHAQELSGKGLSFVPISNEMADMPIQLQWKCSHKNPAVDLFLEMAQEILDEAR